MKKIALFMVAAAALPLAGCYTPEDRAVGGALLGGATGAALGAAATGRGSGALVGGAIGAASGAVIGASTAPGYGRRVYVEPEPVYVARPRCYMEREPIYDSWGRPVGSRPVRVCG